VSAFLERPLDGEWPYLWLDATFLKVREGGRIVLVAAIVAVAVRTDGRREIVGLHIGPSEAETFWALSALLPRFAPEGLVKRGLRGVKLVISDAHEGLKQAVARVMAGATAQRCRVHWMRNALARVPKGQHTMVAAALRQAFLQPDQAGARQTWRHVADQLRDRWPKLGALMDASEADVLAYMAFPAQHRTRLHSTNPLERLNKELKGRADVVGIFPSEASIIRMLGAVLLEQNDEWSVQTRYMQVEGMAELGRHRHRRSHPDPTPRGLTDGHITSRRTRISNSLTDVTPARGPGTRPTRAAPITRIWLGDRPGRATMAAPAGDARPGRTSTIWCGGRGREELSVSLCGVPSRPAALQRSCG